MWFSWWTIHTADITDIILSCLLCSRSFHFKKEYKILISLNLAIFQDCFIAFEHLYIIIVEVSHSLSFHSLYNSDDIVVQEQLIHNCHSCFIHCDISHGLKTWICFLRAIFLMMYQYHSKSAFYFKIDSKKWIGSSWIDRIISIVFSNSMLFQVVYGSFVNQYVGLVYHSLRTSARFIFLFSTNRLMNQYCFDTRSNCEYQANQNAQLNQNAQFQYLIRLRSSSFCSYSFNRFKSFSSFLALLIFDSIRW